MNLPDPVLNDLEKLKSDNEMLKEQMTRVIRVLLNQQKRGETGKEVSNEDL